MRVRALPPRPSDARSNRGDPFVPWYKQSEHLHVKKGRIEGIHARGTLEEVRRKLLHYLRNEQLLMKATGGNNDILLSKADRLIELAVRRVMFRVLSFRKSFLMMSKLRNTLHTRGEREV